MIYSIIIGEEGRLWGAWIWEKDRPFYCIPDYQKGKNYLCAMDLSKNIYDVQWTTGNFVMMFFERRVLTETVTGVMSGDEAIMCWDFPVECAGRHKSGKDNNHANLGSHIIFKIRDRYIA